MSETKPTLWFTPYAWAKLMWMRDKGETEIAGMGIAENSNHLLYMHDFVTLPQRSTSAQFEIDDDAIGEFATKMIEKDLAPAQTCRVCVHTHPGNSATPSGYDETEFKNNYGESDWAVMAILARGNQTYARLRCTKPFPYEQKIDIAVDWHGAFYPSDHEAWLEEFNTNIKEPLPVVKPTTPSQAKSHYAGYTGYNAHHAQDFRDLEWINGCGWVNKQKAATKAKKDDGEEVDVYWPIPLDLNNLDAVELKELQDWADDHEQAALSIEVEEVLNLKHDEEWKDACDEAELEIEMLQEKYKELDAKDYKDITIEEQGELIELADKITELTKNVEEVKEAMADDTSK